MRGMCVLILKQIKLTPKVNDTPQFTGGKKLAIPNIKLAHILGFSRTTSMP